MSEEYLQWLSSTTTNEHFKDPEVRDIILNLVNQVSELKQQRNAIVKGAFNK